MLHGIDISSWQEGMRIPEGIDFCIIKSSEGFRYVDPCAETFARDCIKKGILYGFYHFARYGSPEDNATHFYETVKPHIYDAIMCLDLEDQAIADWGDYAQRFVDRFHSLTGIYPLVYVSASYLSRLAGYPLVDRCGLWVAGYPKGGRLDLGDVPDFPYSADPFDFVSIWQYSDIGRVTGCNYDLDVNVAYMDAKAWKLYADPDWQDKTSTMPKPIDLPDAKRKWTFENNVLKVDVEIK